MDRNEKSHKSPGICREDLERLADILGIGLYKLNIKTGDIDLNPNTAKFTGYDVEDLPNTDYTKHSLIVDEDRPLVDKSMRSILSGKAGHYRIEYSMRRRDSSVATFEEAGFVSDYTESGEPLCVSAMALDLTRLKWAEEKARDLRYELKRQASERDDKSLAEENRLLRAANAAAAMLIGGFHQEYDTVLTQSLQMLGESVRADYIGIWRNTEHGGAPRCYLKYHWTAKGRTLGAVKDEALFCYDDLFPDWKEKLSEKKYLICGADGLPSAFINAFGIKSARSILLAPFYLHGAFWGMIGIAREEKTPFTEPEAEAILSGATIIAFSISRSEIFGKINIDRDKARADTLAKGEFLSRMSHEMRTPLNAIIGMTNIALKEKDARKTDEYLKKIEVSSQLMLNIINDVLDMSKIEAGKLETLIEPFDFTRMMKNAGNIVKVKMDEKRQRFTLNCDSSITRMVLSDEQRLLQVIVNLLNNAMKFTPERGDISLSATQRKIGDSRAKLRVEVRDSGIGLTLEQQKRLFSAFEQADSSITRKYGGTGLGLAICKKILHALGGDIWVQSSSNQGACFFFELEADLGEALGAAAPPGISGAEEITRDWSKYSVLLAEDVEINREIVEITLGETGIRIVSVDNGKEAVGKFLEDPGKYDLILMDVQMPVMDGLSATRRIRATDNPRAKQIPIIAMTANAFREDIHACKEAGMNEHIAKPIAMDAFFTVLGKYLK